MSNEAVIQAVYWDYKRVPTRNSFQIICEVPIEQAAQVHKVLGQPNPKESMWVAIAKLDPSAVEIGDDEAPVVKESRKWEDLKPSQQSGIRCQEMAFSKFLMNLKIDPMHKDGDPAAQVRWMCGVESRSDLDRDEKAGFLWKELDHDYVVWRDTPDL